MVLTITKKISKQGKNLVLIIPRDLHAFLNSGDLVEVNINKLLVDSKDEQQSIERGEIINKQLLEGEKDE